VSGLRERGGDGPCFLTSPHAPVEDHRPPHVNARGEGQPRILIRMMMAAAAPQAGGSHRRPLCGGCGL
jgi:hypothetical protein